jgi:hypothetical protein
VKEAGHVAVVPVLTIDDETSEALSFAARLAPSVFAVHICQSHEPDGLQIAWSQTGMSEPLIVVESAGLDYAKVFERTMQVLLREDALQEITVVVPSQQNADWRDGLRSAGSVVVRRMPGRPPNELAG